MNDMQFLMLMTLISVTVPGITLLIQGVLLNFVQMDILQTDKWLFDLVFDDDTNALDGPLNPFFDQNGLTSRTFIKCVGSALIFLLIFILLLVAMSLCKIIGLCF
jgi:hypothetical protein